MVTQLAKTGIVITITKNDGGNYDPILAVQDSTMTHKKHMQDFFVAGYCRFWLVSAG